MVMIVIGAKKKKIGNSSKTRNIKTNSCNKNISKYENNKTSSNNIHIYI